MFIETFLGEATIKDIPEQVKDFLCEQIRSVRQLEILLWLKIHKAGGTAEQIARELYTSNRAVSDEIAPLIEAGFIRHQSNSSGADSYQYNATRWDAAIEELSSIYGDYRVRVIELIFLRNPGEQKTFSDALNHAAED